MSLPNLADVVSSAVRAVELSHSERAMSSSSSSSSSQRKKTEGGNYRILDYVSPLYTNIYLVESEDDRDSVYVVKKLPSSHLRLSSVFLEGAIQRFLSDDVVSRRHTTSDHIVRFVDHYFESTHIKQEYCIVMEYCTLGSVYQFIETYNSMITREVSVGLMRDLIKGMHYMHSLGVAHRDIKLENLMLSYNKAENRYVLKIGDFGFARYVYSDKMRESTICGSLHYLSPEIFRQEDRHPFVSDIWAMGICIYALFEFTYPFDYGDVIITHEAVAVGRRIFKSACFTLLYPRMKDNLGFINLISNILTPTPLTRYTTEECLEHYFVKFARHQDLTPQMIRHHNDIYEELRNNSLTSSGSQTF